MERKEDLHGRMQVQLADRTVPLEIAAEFTLPDYRSEISRLLWVRPTLMPPERFIGGGKAEFSGQVFFEALYTGPDGLLYGAELDTGYSFSVPLDSEIEDPQLFAIPIADAVISRVSGPRKLSVRCRAHTQVRGYGEKALSLTLKDAPKDATPAQLCDTVQVGRVIGGGREEITLTDMLELEEDVRVICARGNVFLPDVHAAEDEVLCRGEVQLTLLLCREEEDSAPFTLSRCIPFEERVALEGAQSAHHACATGTVGRIDYSIENGSLCLSPALTLVAQVQYEEPLTLCRDVFLPACREEKLTRTEHLWQNGGCCNRHFTISCERPLAEFGIGEECEIIDLISEAEICEKTSDGTKHVLSGKLHCHLLCRRGGELCTTDAIFPFRLTPELGGEQLAVDAHVCDCRVSIRGTTLRADAELQLTLCLPIPFVTTFVNEVSFQAAPARERADVELYYPAPGQTLWDVAKHYGIPPEALAELNALPCDAPDDAHSLAGKSFLLIP